MRKGIKLLAAITAAAVVSTMSISAFGLTYETETNYANGTVSVKTTVTLSETEKDDEVAYLVYDVGTDPSSTTIKYIDQKTATSDTLTFDWTTTDATINANAYVGTTETPATAAVTPDGKTNIVKVAGYDVTYGVSGKGVVVPATEIDTAEIDGEDIGATATLNAAEAVFYVFPEVGYVFDDVTGDNMAYSTNGNGDFVTVTFTADATITFNFVPSEVATAANLVAGDSDDVADVGKVFKIATATGAITEAGILVAPNAAAAEKLGSLTAIADAETNGIYVMKAWQIGSDGTYAVSVENATEIEAGAAVSAYAVDANGTLHIAK